MAGGVTDGQDVDAAVTDAAFLHKNAAEQMPYELDFTGTASGQGSTVTDIQKNVNALWSFIGGALNSVYNILPTWVTNNFGTSGDTLLARVKAIDASFTPASGANARRAANVSIGSGVSSVTVAFTTAWPTTAYVPVIVFMNTTDSTPIFLQGTITGKTVNGFTVTFNAPTDSANYVLSYSVSGAA